MTHWLAILRAPAPRTLPEGVTATPAAGLVAVTAAEPALPRGSGRRAAALRAAQGRQARLEALMEAPALLPVHGPAPDPGALLEENAGEIGAWLDRLAGRVQFQITVGWDLSRAAARFEGTQSFGGRARTAAHLAARMEGVLGGVALDAIPLPVSGPGMVLNRVLLIDRAAEGALDAAVAEIDAIWTEGLSIRLVGPSPAVSFAQGTPAAARQGDPEAARRLLSLPLGAGAGAIRQARRAALLRGAAPEAVARAVAVLEQGPGPRLEVRRDGTAAPVTPTSLPPPVPCPEARTA